MIGRAGRRSLGPALRCLVGDVRFLFVAARGRGGGMRLFARSPNRDTWKKKENKKNTAMFGVQHFYFILLLNKPLYTSPLCTRSDAVGVSPPLRPRRFGFKSFLGGLLYVLPHGLHYTVPQHCLLLFYSLSRRFLFRVQVGTLPKKKKSSLEVSVTSPVFFSSN